MAQISERQVTILVDARTATEQGDRAAAAGAGAATETTAPRALDRAARRRRGGTRDAAVEAV